MVSSRSSRSFLMKGVPVRAVTFQSMSLTSSPGRIFAHLVEVHAAALEDGMVFAGEGVGDQPPRAQLDLAHFLQDFSGDGGVHGGELRTENVELRTKNEELRTKNEELRTKN